MSSKQEHPIIVTGNYKQAIMDLKLSDNNCKCGDEMTVREERLAGMCNACHAEEAIKREDLRRFK